MTLFRHEMKRAWKSLLIWTLSIGSFIAICLLIYPEMKRQMDSISSMFANMGSFSSAFGLDTLEYGTLKGYYGIECGEVLGLGGALFAALLGVNALSKEEKNGTAEFLLTHPRSRTEIVTAKLASVLVQIVVLNVTVWLMAIAFTAVIGEAVPWAEFSLLHLAYFLMHVEIACVCFGLSACTGKGGVGIGLGLTIGMYFLNIIANLSKSVDFLKYITPFGYCDGSSIVNSLSLNAGMLLIGLALTAAGVALAYWRYNKKDIR